MNVLSAIVLTTPLMLAGMAAVALPIVAHLLNRRARQRIVFPTIRLLQASAASQSRLFRLRRLVLLALRCLAIVLIAWAFARPVWVDRAAAGGGEGGVAVVLVLDVSASMQQQESGVPLMHAMSAAAADAIAELRPGRDVADVVFATAQPRAAFGEPVANLDAITAEIRAVQPTQERAAIGEAVSLARSILQHHAGPRRIEVFSDMQAGNWAGVDLAASADGVEVTVTPVGRGTAANVALSQPRMLPARPIAGQSATAAATVTNHADRPQRVQVDLELDGRRAGSRELTLQPAESRPIAFDVMFEKLGDHAIRFTATPDDLATDNTLHGVADVVPHTRVLLISDHDAQDPAGDAFFLSRAIAPGDESAGGARVNHVRSDRVRLADVAAADVVVVGDAATLGDDAARIIVEHVERGGGLIVFQGGVRAGSAAAALTRAAGERRILPFSPVPLISAELRHITGGAWTTAALRHFDLAAQDALSRVPIHTQHQAGDLSETAMVLLRYADGAPALATQPFGRGEVAAATFSVTPPNDLPKHGLFVALMHGLIDQVRPQSASAQPLTVGEPAQVSLNVPSGTPLDVTGPDGASLLVRQSDELAGGTTIAIPRVPMAGIYRVALPDGGVHLLAANVDERESDLTRVDPQNAQASDVIAAAVAAGASKPLRDDGLPLWPMLMLAAMGVIAAELALLNLWKR